MREVINSLKNLLQKKELYKDILKKLYIKWIPLLNEVKKKLIENLIINLTKNEFLKLHKFINFNF